jgi:hypothetical protein
MHNRHKPPGAVPIAVIIAMALLAACGTSSGKGITPLKTTTSVNVTNVTTADPPTTTTLVTSDAAAVAADQAEIALYFQVASQNPINPADPRLATSSMGQALGYHRNQLTVLNLKRQHDVGSFLPTQSRVTQRNTTGLPAGHAMAVVVASCAIDTIAVVDDASGQIVTPATNSREPITERLDLVDGHWLVSETGTGSGKC